MRYNEDINKLEFTEEEYYTLMAKAKKNGTTFQEEVDTYVKYGVKKVMAMNLTKDDLDMLRLLYDLARKSGE